MKTLKKLIIGIAAMTLLLASGCHSGRKADGFLSEGLALLDQGRYAEAREAFTKAAVVQSNSVSAYYNLGYVCWKMGDRDVAIRRLNKAVELSRDDQRPAEMLAYILLQGGNYEGADRVLAEIENPDAVVLTLRAETFWRRGKTDLARSYLAKAIEANQDYAPALYNLAVLYRDAEQDRREALAYYKRYRLLAPHDSHAALSPQAFIAAGEQAQTAGGSESKTLIGNKPPIATDLTNTVSKPVKAENKPKPDNSEHQTDVKERLAQAEQAIKHDNADVALVILRKTVSNHPDNPDVIWALAELYDKYLGQKTSAASTYKKFRLMFPHDGRSTIAARRLKALSSSGTKSKPGETVSHKSGEDYFRAGLDAYNRRQYKKAIEAYRNGLRLNPKSSRIAYNLGLAYKANQDLKNAAKAFRFALQVQPEKVNALYMLGLTELESGDNDAALKYLNRLLRVQPDFAKAHYLLGTVYSREGRPDMTAIHFERFLELEPSGPSANQVRGWLKKHKVN